jgi:hypothetical protein
MTAGTIHLSERSKHIYAKRCAHQPRLLDVRMSYGSSVRAFKRPRNKLAVPGQEMMPADSLPPKPKG